MKNFKKSLRLERLPSYIFSEINQKKSQLKKSGVDLIDLGMGDPDLSTPKLIVEELRKTASEVENQKYAPYAGLDEFQSAAGEWLERRFSIPASRGHKIINLIGTKEGIVNFTFSVVNPGDFVLIPNPGYPVYTNAVVLAGGTPVYYPLRPENQFRPNWNEISEEVWRATKLIYINFPNNPTSASVGIETYRELVQLAKRYDVIVLSDSPYTEHSFEELAPCFLQVPEAIDVGVETFSLSKTYNMTGWRIGFAAGNPEMVDALLHMKSCVDTGVFRAIQKAAICALSGNDDELIMPSKEVFRYRREMMLKGLQQKGYEIFDGKSTFYLWIKTPANKGSIEVCEALLQKGIVCTPGIGFGSMGEGWFRMALTVPEERLQEALRRLPSVSEF
jgi:LL-diaminopimelate aminotransferase